jgi:hypothetical protein
MEKVVGLFKPKVSPQEQLREWQRKLRQESRNVDRQIRGMVASTLVFSHFLLAFLPLNSSHVDVTSCDRVRISLAPCFGKLFYGMC